MCGAAACALSASRLAHFSTTTKVSPPKRACSGPTPSASTVAVYSMHPSSAFTAGTLAWNASSIRPRKPGLAAITATTWTMDMGSLPRFAVAGGDATRRPAQPQRRRPGGCGRRSLPAAAPDLSAMERTSVGAGNSAANARPRACRGVSRRPFAADRRTGGGGAACRRRQAPADRRLSSSASGRRRSTGLRAARVSSRRRRVPAGSGGGRSPQILLPGGADPPQ